MGNSTLALLQSRLRNRGANLAQISTAAAILCDIIDEKEELWFHDRNRYDLRIRELEAKITKLESKGQPE